jgi:hypothetical protein
MYFFGEDACEVVGGEIRFHDLDLFAMWIFAGYALVGDVVGTDLSPIPLIAWLG